MSLALWTEALLPRLPGAPEPFVKAELVRTIQDFCTQSTALRGMIHGLNLTADEREVVVEDDEPEKTTVIGVLRVYAPNVRFVDYSHAPWEVYMANAPVGYTVEKGPPVKLVFSDIPDRNVEGYIHAYVYSKPTDPESYLPPLLLHEFEESVLDGTLGRLLSVPEKPYTDTKTAIFHLGRYRRRITQARVQANQGFTGNAQNWTFPRFAK